MKSMQQFAVLMFSLLAFSAFKLPAKAGQNAKIIVLVNHAQWCPVCQVNGMRINNEVISKFANDSNYLIVSNDLSTKESKAESQLRCQKAGISAFATKHSGTGSIFLLRAKDLHLIQKISVTESTESIQKAIVQSLNSL